jgi:O-antigen/teichoic acid export membrane protein
MSSADKSPKTMSTDQALLPVPAERGSEFDRADATVDRVRRQLGEAVARLRGSAIVLSIGTAFAMFFLTAVQGVLLARLLGPTARGEFGTAIFYTQFLTYVGLLGTQLSIARRAARRLDDPAAFARSAAWLGCITGVGTMMVVSLLALVALPGEKSYLAPLCIFCALFLPTEHVRLSLLAIDHGAGRFTRYNAHRLLASLILPAMLLVVWLAGYGSLMLIVALSIVAPIVPLAVRFVTEEHAWFGPVSPRPTTLIKEGVPNAIALAASDLLNRLDVFLILWLTPFSTQGFYAAAVPAASLLIVGPNTMALFAFNAGARQTGPLRPGALASTVAAVVAFQMVAGVAFAVVIGPLITLVYGEAFRGAVPFALALLPAAAVNGCAVVAEGYLQGRGRASIGVWCRLRGAVVMLAFVWLFQGTWGALSIPLAASVGQAVNALWVLWAVGREAVTATRPQRPE